MKTSVASVSRVHLAKLVSRYRTYAWGVALLLVALCSLVTPSDAAKPLTVVSDARIEANASQTTITLKVSAPVAIEAFVLSQPYRLVVDLPEVRFDLANASRAMQGLVVDWRAGLFATGRSRIVFDLNAPVQVTAKRLQSHADGSADVIIECKAIGAAEFAAAARAAALAKGQGAEAEPDSKGDRQSTTIGQPARRLVIVLDPGHGGIDAGTVSPRTGVPEKQVVLEFAAILEKKLAETGRYEVYRTRTDDTFVPLGDRVKFARAHHADLLVSIHADAELDRSVRGSTVFTRADRASDAAAAALAVKENQSDALAGIANDDTTDDVADILVDLVKRETRSFSHALAEKLVEAMSKSGHMVKRDPHRSAQLVVLKAYDFPSVLVELGFLSNADDERELVSPQWRNQTADAIVTALDKFFSTRLTVAKP